MKIGVIADIHSNFEALKAVLADLKEKKVKTLVNCGDIIGYGPEPVKCIEMIMAMNGGAAPSLEPAEKELASFFTISNVMGNHDAGAINFTDISCFNRNAYEALVWTREQLGAEHVAFIKTLPYKLEKNGAAFYHSTPQMTRNWYYMDSLEMAQQSFVKGSGHVFVAHTHKAYIYVRRTDGGKISGIFPGERDCALDAANQYIINPGSVGQPRDGNYMPSYMIWDCDARKIKMHRCDYDVMITQRSLAATPLPYILGERLLLGK